jgi:predicted alpha/beta-hydrolase family hydrolase
MIVELETPAGPARADLTLPAEKPKALLALTHGANGSMNAPDLHAVRDAAIEAGFAVALVSQAFAVAGRRTPPKPVLQDPAWVAAIQGLQRQRGLKGLPLYLGGRSNGARVACRTAKELEAAGVVCLAFPVHPPGKPENSRLGELDDAGVPTLVVQGDRDPFGMPPGGNYGLVVIPGGDHGLKKDLPAIARAVLAFL